MIEIRLLSLSAIIMLSACVVPPTTNTQPETDAPQPNTSEAAVDATDTGEESPPPLSPEAIQAAIDNHVEESIRLLQHGQVDGASIQLAAALRLDPNNAIANSLLQQIDTDPVEALGEKHFTYTVRRNDSLSKLAKRYLKDPYQFFILARYNGIDNPDRLHAGQTIKIPGERPKTLAAADKAPARPAKPAAAPTPERTDENPHQKQLQHVNELLANQDYPAAIAALENMIAQSDKRNAEVEQVFVHTHLNYAAILQASGNMTESRDTLLSALNVIPDNTALSLKLEETENNIAADTFFQEGLQKLEEQQLESAYRYFTDAMELNPTHKDAAIQAEQAKSSLIARHDKTAMAAYRRQDLDTAIAQWQKVLDLDPENERAKHYHTLSMELQQRIQEF